MRICLYSANFGGYDPQRTWCPQSMAHDSIIFTDNRRYVTNPKYKIVSTIFGNPRIDAKIYKLLPQIYLSQYDVVIWIDSSIDIVSRDFVKDMVHYLGDKPLALIKHYERQSIKDEERESLTTCANKYKGSLISDQVRKYLSEGFPLRFGLWLGGIHIRNNRDKRIWQLNDMWWQEEQKYKGLRTTNDQISLAYSIWKLNLKDEINIIPFKLWQTSVKWLSHLKNT